MICRGDTVGDQVSFLYSRISPSFEPGSLTWSRWLLPPDLLSFASSVLALFLSGVTPDGGNHLEGTDFTGMNVLSECSPTLGAWHSLIYFRECPTKGTRDYPRL